MPSTLMPGNPLVFQQGLIYRHACALMALLLASLMMMPSVRASAAPVPDISGTWQGGYQCGLDRMALTLTILPPASGGLQAEFTFRVLAGPHRGEQGRFAMLGSYTGTRGQIRLKPSRMIEMPPGFIAVALSGVLSADSMHLKGPLALKGCSEFQVTRQAQAPGTPVDAGGQPPPASTAAPRSGAERRQTLLAESLARDEATLQKGASPLLEVEMGRGWGERFRQRYQKSWTEPAVVALYERYLKKRDGDLRGARAELVTLFESTTESLQIDALEKKFLHRQQDQRLEAGRDILGVLDQHKQVLRDAEEQSKYSPGEHALMGPQGRLPLAVPVNYPEPEPEDINLAILRELVSVGGRMLSGAAVEVGLPPFDQFMPLRLDAIRVEKQSCRLGQNPRSYSCDYRHFLAVSIPEVTWTWLRTGGRSKTVEDLLTKSLALVNAKEPVVVTHVFVLTSDGWRSPSMHKVIVDGAAKNYAEMLAALPSCTLVEEAGKIRCY